MPKIQSFSNVQNSVKDPLTTAKLQFFVSQCRLFSPFLDHYQTEATMLPFLADDLAGILE